MNVCSLSIGIRDFKSFYQEDRSELVLSVVNRVFAMINKVIIEYGGMVAYFKGSDALVTWGTVPGTSADEDASIGAACTILHELIYVNEEFRGAGMPEVRLSMGLAHGDVMVGYVGSQDRAEFQCIGRAVNYSHFLKEICDTADSEFLIEGSLLDSMNASIRKNWLELDNIVSAEYGGALRIGSLRESYEEMEVYYQVSLENRLAL